MIYLISGDNAYRVRQELQKLTKNFAGEVVRLDGTDLDLAKLTDLIAGATLFGADKIVIIRSLSNNAVLWQNFESWSGRVSDSTTLVLLEGSVDKRTKTYKTLKKTATVIDATQWTERDVRDAEAWLDKLAHASKLVLTRPQVSQMVRRAIRPTESGKAVIDQMTLFQAVRSLIGAEKVSDKMIDAVLPADMNENIFELLGRALQGDRQEVERMVRHLKATDDPYRVMALLASQWTQFVALAGSQQSPSVVAENLSVHPYGLQKMVDFRGKFSRQRLHTLSTLLADKEYESKSTAIDPWYAVERFLFELTH